MSEIEQWIDENGVLRCNATFQTARPLAATVIADRGSCSFIGLWKAAELAGRVQGVPIFRLRLGQKRPGGSP